MSTRCFLTVLTITLAADVAAQEVPSYVCQNGSLERHVQVIYETGLLVPCEVHYLKDGANSENSEVLWRALNEEGYCEAKAAEFVAKLEGWGWQCSRPDAQPPSEQPAVEEPAMEHADDTDALAPSSDEPGGN